MPLDWKSLDLRWKIAHGVLYTAHRLLLFGLFDVPLACFCGHPAETLEHLFFHCPLAQNGLDWIQFFCFCPLHWSLTFLFATFFFCFKDDVLLWVPRVFCYLLSLLKSCLFSNFVSVYRFESKPPCAFGLIASIKSRLFFTNRCSSNASNPGAGAVFSSVNGVPIGTLVKSWVPHFVFLFNFYRSRSGGG